MEGKIITITESQLKTLVERVASQQILNEYFGIDVSNMEVTYNPNNQRNTYTNDINNPKLVDLTNNTTSKKYKVYSIFQKQDEENRDNQASANALGNALKNKDGYYLNDKKTLDSIWNIVDTVCSTLKGKFDAIIVSPSNNKLNYDFANILSKASGCNVVITDLVQKLPCDYVYDKYVKPYENKFKKIRFIGNISLYDALIQGFNKMKTEHNGMFSYSALKNMKLRQIFNDTLNIKSELIGKYADLINDKRIVIIDDILTSGKTLSEMSNFILSTFTPSDIVFLTLIGCYKDKKLTDL